jgi:hypothetical protein
MYSGNSTVKHFGNGRRLNPQRQPPSKGSTAVGSNFRLAQPGVSPPAKHPPYQRKFMHDMEDIGMEGGVSLSDPTDTSNFLQDRIGRDYEVPPAQ